MAGLVPDIRPDDPMFHILKAIAIALDVNNQDAGRAIEKLFLEFQTKLTNFNGIYGHADLVDSIERLLLAVLRGERTFERGEIAKLERLRAAKARSHKETLSKIVDKIIVETILSTFPSLKKGESLENLTERHTPHGIATRIFDQVSRALKTQQIRGIGTSALAKRVKKLVASRTAD